MDNTQSLREWLGEAPFTLGLSSGFFGFFAHAGVLAALSEAGLRPTAIVGSSAGALSGGLWAAGVPIDTLHAELRALRKEDFWDPAPGFGLMRGKLFQNLLQNILPISQFEECEIKLSVSAFDVYRRETTVIDSGDLASAIQASCAVPLMFHPCWRSGRPLLDGGILDRHGLNGAQPGSRILHHHLNSRSPWRSPDSPGLQPPEGPDLTAFVIDGLPRLGPFRLEEGPRAINMAHRIMAHTLDKPVRALMQVRGNA